MPSQTETLARDLFAYYLPDWRQQHNLRPDWLRYPPTGRNLELDLFFPEQHVAIEVQGVQHGRPIDGLQPTFADFLVQQRRDMFKREACERQGVTLYTLTSFDMTQRRFEPFIRGFMTESQWRTKNPPIHLYRRAERLTRMKVVRPPRKNPRWWWPF